MLLDEYVLGFYVAVDYLGVFELLQRQGDLLAEVHDQLFRHPAFCLPQEFVEVSAFAELSDDETE